MSTTKVYSLNVLQRFIFGFCICMFMFACSKENAQTKTGLQNGKTYETNQISEVQNNGENYSNRGQSLLEFAEERYNVEVRENQDGSFLCYITMGKF